MKAWAVTLGVFALVLGLATMAGGFGLFGWTVNLLREWPGWTELPVFVLGSLGLSTVEFGLLGVILILLAVLTAVLAQGPYAPKVREREAREARMVQDLFHGFCLMEKRLDSIESTMLRRVGRWSLGSKPN